MLMIVGAFLGYQIMDMLGLTEEINLSFSGIITNNTFYGVLVGGIIGFILLPIIVKRFVKLIVNLEDKLEGLPIKDIIAGIVGLVSGLALGVLIVIAFSISEISRFGTWLQIIINLVLGYLGCNLAIKKRGELFSVLAKIRKKDDTTINKAEEDESKATYKILDTSAIIDGRIADICKTSFVEGILVIPKFVLEELQHIADSSNLLKRNRGRRGLDILNKIQKELDIPVEIYEEDFDDIDEVDSKLVQLGKLIGGKVVTNDYNLNKVAQLQGVAVLNINDLANAVKPVVLPGEEMEVKIIKDGKEPKQGIGYLDDGTMIVVDHGRDYIGEKIDVLVTSILQTSAGRMIFAKPKVIAEHVL